MGSFDHRLAASLGWMLLDKSPVGISVADLDTGLILKVNERFTRTFGYTLEDIPDLDRWFHRAYPEQEYRQKVTTDWGALVDRYREVGDPIPDLEVKVACAYGGVRRVVISTALAGSLIVATFVDHTARAEAEAALADLNRSLEEKVRSRTDELEKAYRDLMETEKLAVLGHLTAGMAHELGTPLGAIQAANGLNLDTLRGPVQGALALLTGLDAADRDYFLALTARNQGLSEAVPGQANRATRAEVERNLQARGLRLDPDLVEYLVELGPTEADCDHLAAGPQRPGLLQAARDFLILQRMSRIIAEGVERATHQVEAMRQYVLGKEDDSQELFLLAEQLETILTLFQHKTKHGVEVVRNFDVDTACQGDRQKLGQVWMNLIHNALQAMEFRGTLRVSAHREPSGLVVRIGDDGPGIPEAIQAKIFTPYFTTKKHGQGLGLGLDLCRKILLDHRGSIDFESRPGNTVFTVSLPLPQELSPCPNPSSFASTTSPSSSKP